MLKALSERFVADRYEAEQRRAYQAEPCGYSHDNWAMLGDLGLLAAFFSEEHGGLGVERTGLITLMEALGRGLVVEPVAENIGLAGKLVARLASGTLADALLPGVISGKTMIAVAHRERNARQNEHWVETRAEQSGDHHVLNGEKSFVAAGCGADAYIVSARLTGSTCDEGGAGLFLVDRDAPGLEAQPWRLADGTRAVALRLKNVAATHLLGCVSELSKAQAEASLWRCAEALGVMERLFTDTIDYLRTRKQFGVSLGTFQALQHRMVAQYAILEQARGLLFLAAMVDSGDVLAFEKRVQGARAFIADAAITFGHEMIQMHGGMGVTDELAIGHGHKRLMVLSRWPEDATAALDRYAA